MNELEKEFLDKAKKDFERSAKAKAFGKNEETQLLSDLTCLLGWYRLEPLRVRAIEKLIEEMIVLGEKNNFSMAGARIEFENMKERKKRRKK